MTTALMTKSEIAKARKAEQSAAFYASLATLLRTNEQNVRTRALRLKLTPACGRCGGSGHYSYNQMSGTTCFGCNGLGRVLPKSKAEQAQTMERAEACVASGELDAYLARNAAQRRCKNGKARAFAAWGELEKLNKYNWREAADRARAGLAPLPAEITNRVGADLIDALDKLEKASGYKPEKMDWVAFEAVLTEGIAKLAALTAELRAKAVDA